MAARAQKVVGASVRELQAGIASGMKKLEEHADNAQVTGLLDTVCGAYLGGDTDSSITTKNHTANSSSGRRHGGRVAVVV